MQVSKLTHSDAETLADYKRTKAPLGVIHPLPSKVVKDSDDEDFSDLVITAKPLKPGQRAESKPELPAHLVSPVMRKKSPAKQAPRPPWGRRKPAKKSGKIMTAKQQAELKAVSLNILKSIPEFMSTLSKKKKLSLLRGKDLATSTREYKSKIANLAHVNKDKERVKLEDGQDEAFRLLNQKFSKLQLSEEEYNKTYAEVQELRRLYDQQIWKEKIIGRFLAEHTEGDLDIKALNRLLGQRQLKQEHAFLAMQKFSVGLKDFLMTKDQLSYVVAVKMGELSSFIRGYTPKLSETDRDHVIYFIEQVKLGITDSHQENLSIKAFEETLERLFVTWDQEKAMIEAFNEDVTQAFCYEQKVNVEEIFRSDRPKSSKQLELRIVAEFISQYFDRLSDSMKKKIQTLERILYKLTYGKEMPRAWGDLLKGAKEEVKDAPRTAAQVSGAPQARPESAKPKTTGLLQGRPESAKPQTTAPQKAGVTGRAPAKRPESAKPSVPSKAADLGVSRKNPLDSLTSLNESMDKDLDDFINVLNAKEPAKSSASSSPRAPLPSKLSQEPSIPAKGNPSSLISQKPSVQGRGPQLNPPSISPKRSNSPEFRAPSRYTNPEDFGKNYSPFASIEGPLRESNSERIQGYKSRLAQLEAQQAVRSEFDEQGVRLSRADLLKTGAVKFAPYLDAEGKLFDPAEKFKYMERPNARATDIDPLYLFEMTQKKPGKEDDWFVRPHHLQSVTNHPFSINDDPLVVRKKDLPSTTRPPPSKEHAPREQAVSHLESVLDDLKCELEERRRALRTKVYTTEADEQEQRYTGWVAKAADTFA
jgi:hypothetical protein